MLCLLPLPMLIASAFGLYFALHYALPLCTLYRTLPLIIDYALLRRFPIAFGICGTHLYI